MNIKKGVKSNAIKTQVHINMNMKIVIKNNIHMRLKSTNFVKGGKCKLWTVFLVTTYLILYFQYS